MKRKQPTSPPILHKGQLWKSKTARVEIMDMGKLLAHYRYFDERRTHETPVKTLHAPLEV
jgi:hypothetical protein